MISPNNYSEKIIRVECHSITLTKTIRIKKKKKKKKTFWKKLLYTGKNGVQRSLQYFSFWLKNRLWVPVRTASSRRSYDRPMIYASRKNKEIPHLNDWKEMSWIEPLQLALYCMGMLFQCPLSWVNNDSMCYFSIKKMCLKFRWLCNWIRKQWVVSF